MKNKNLLGEFASLVVGVILLFLGILFLDGGSTAAVILGLIYLLLGLGYIAFGVLDITKVTEKVNVLGKISDICKLSMLPLFYFVYVLEIVCDYDGITAVGWILSILKLIVSLSIIVFVILFLTFLIPTLDPKFLFSLNIFFFLNIIFFIK